MDVKNKPTVLDDDAGIYQKRVVKTEKQKFSELHGEDKWQYFKDYYLKKTIAIILGIILVIYFIYTIWQSKKQTNVLYAATVDQYLSPNVVKQLEDSFKEYIGSTSEYDSVILDTSYYLNSLDYSTQEKLQALIVAGDIDVFIAPESYFTNYTVNGTMQALNDCLPTDLVSLLKNEFFIGSERINSSLDDEIELGPSEAYGIYVDETPLFKDNYKTDERLVLGIIVTSKNKDNAVEFIRFLFNEFVPDTSVE